ncbi:hypothetical protein BZM27_23170 [Paraburkholderia steynii]|uniref:Uncharacterized protein n=1 Tax=Paraburkholderia steynii TaxID=1245441 RepID=A0A4R0X9B9_9BURK|nr:hypothetical protein BZM27_23170 [Paraburkholderia steynii]
MSTLGRWPIVSYFAASHPPARAALVVKILLSSIGWVTRPIAQLVHQRTIEADFVDAGENFACGGGHDATHARIYVHNHHIARAAAIASRTPPRKRAMRSPL